MNVDVSLTREEALACIIVLENRKRLYGWQYSALLKLLKAMGLKELPTTWANSPGKEFGK